MSSPYEVACAVLALINLLSIGVAAIRLRASGGEPRIEPPPPVTIIRPLSGLEPFTEETLASGFRLDARTYEVILCVAKANDPVIPVARRVMAAHPDVPARLLIGDDRISENPKLNNCVKGWAAAQHEWVILADSNVLMPRDYVQQLLAAWRSDTGLVCSTPIGSRPQGFWAEVECAFLNTLQARWQYAGEALGLGFAQGKSMLWRRSFLNQHGGIRALAAEIAEDAAATKLVRAAGLHVHLVGSPFEQPLGGRSASQVWARQMRWARLRLVTFPLFFVPEIFTTGLTLVLIGALGAVLGDGSGLGLAAALLALWYGAELALATAKGWHVSWRMPLAFLVRDGLILALWCSAWAKSEVVWHGNAMDLQMRSGAENL